MGIVAAVLLFGPIIALAQTSKDDDIQIVTGPTVVTGPSGSESEGLINPLNNIDSLEDLLAAVLRAVVRIGAIFLTLALIYVGFRFVAAQGRSEEIKKVRGMLMWTVIGGLILLGAEAIARMIQQTVQAL